MKIAIAQINPIIADIKGNTAKIIDFIRQAREAQADLAIFPELATIGYPPMDLLESKKLVEDNLAALDAIAIETSDIAVICGCVDCSADKPSELYNSAAFIHDQKIIFKQAKSLLPTYDVFDELRYFTAAEELAPIIYKGLVIGLTICEDIWNVTHLEDQRLMGNRVYAFDPIEIYRHLEADLIINISASPFVKKKTYLKQHMLQSIAKKNQLPIIYVNQVGGNDSLVFDGASMAIDSKGNLVYKAKSFDEDLLFFDFNPHDIMQTLAIPEYTEPVELEEIRRALILGIKDYVRKCGFKRVIVGLSGGIDSALTATLAVQALGPENVLGITMPSPFSSQGSVDDSYALAKNLGMRIETVSIQDLFRQFNNDLAPLFKGLPSDITEENIQARIRGNILMAVSNKLGSLLLTTGNKSELAMGYCTLYGDMSGGLAVISDLPKTLVYKLSQHINRDGEIIPNASLTKPPSAELRENQTDQDSLPPYDVLDGILELYIEENLSLDDIIRQGYAEDVVKDVLRKVNINEYKRRQAAPGIKITSKAFGFGRRIPIAQNFKP